MSWQFRKSKSLGNGIRLNFGKNGIGISGGIKGLRYSKGADGKIRRTISIPHTGLRKTEIIGGNKNNKSENNKHRNILVSVLLLPFRLIWWLIKYLAIGMVLGAMGALVGTKNKKR